VFAQGRSRVIRRSAEFRQVASSGDKCNGGECVEMADGEEPESFSLCGRVFSCLPALEGRRAGCGQMER